MNESKVMRNRAKVKPETGENSPRFVSLEFVANMFSCSPRTIRRLISAGKLPRPIKVGRLIRLEYHACLAVMERGMTV